jgi:SAM-dependent methyltransferase
MELEKYLEIYKPSILNLGCGRGCKPEHYGIDIEDYVGVSKVWDLTQGIPIDGNTFDEVIAKDILEHIPQGKLCVKIMEEIYRVLKPGGRAYIDVPSTDGGGVGAFGNPYHISFWNKDTIKYYLDDKYTGGWRSSIGVNCWFIPESVITYYNKYDTPYVEAVLKKRVE